MVADEIQSEINGHYLGCARIPISNLEPGSARGIDEGNVSRLVRIFERGCHRYDPGHFVPVIVDELLLTRMAEQQGVAISALTYQSPPLLQVPSDTRLECLHGRHRLLAARKYLQRVVARERWWGVVFYKSSLSPRGRQYLRERPSASLEFSDGDIFRYQRKYHIAQDRVNAERWRVLFSKTKERNLKQLERSELRDPFDSLLGFSGLWAGLQLGAFNRIFPMQCLDEIARYLEKIRLQWTTLLGTDLHPSKLDINTVQSLELRCPRDSQNDATILRRLMSTKSIFPEVSNEQSRESLLSRLLQCTRILSLHSLAEDTIYMQACQASLMHILPNRAQIKDGFRSGLQRYFGHDEKYFAASYLDLWLHAMRYFPELADLPCCDLRKDKGHSKPRRAQVVTQRVRELAFRAYSLGFCSEQIVSILDPCSNDPVLDCASVEAPLVTTNLIDTEIKFRCNRPSQMGLRRDREHLFLKWIYSPRPDQPKSYVTTFYILQEIVYSFWGTQAPQFADDPQRLNVASWTSETQECRATFNSGDTSRMDDGSALPESVESQDSSTAQTQESTRSCNDERISRMDWEENPQAGSNKRGSSDTRHCATHQDLNSNRSPTSGNVVQASENPLHSTHIQATNMDSSTRPMSQNLENPPANAPPPDLSAAGIEEPALAERTAPLGSLQAEVMHEVQCPALIHDDTPDVDPRPAVEADTPPTAAETANVERGENTDSNIVDSSAQMDYASLLDQHPLSVEGPSRAPSLVGGEMLDPKVTGEPSKDAPYPDVDDQLDQDFDDLTGGRADRDREDEQRIRQEHQEATVRNEEYAAGFSSSYPKTAPPVLASRNNRTQKGLATARRFRPYDSADRLRKQRKFPGTKNAGGKTDQASRPLEELAQPDPALAAAVTATDPERIPNKRNTPFPGTWNLGHSSELLLENKGVDSTAIQTAEASSTADQPTQHTDSTNSTGKSQGDLTYSSNMAQSTQHTDSPSHAASAQGDLPVNRTVATSRGQNMGQNTAVVDDTNTSRETQQLPPPPAELLNSLESREVGFRHRQHIAKRGRDQPPLKEVRKPQANKIYNAIQDRLVEGKTPLNAFVFLASNLPIDDLINAQATVLNERPYETLPIYRDNMKNAWVSGEDLVSSFSKYQQEGDSRTWKWPRNPQNRLPFVELLTASLRINGNLALVLCRGRDEFRPGLPPSRMWDEVCGQKKSSNFLILTLKSSGERIDRALKAARKHGSFSGQPAGEALGQAMNDASGPVPTTPESDESEL